MGNEVVKLSRPDATPATTSVPSASDLATVLKNAIGGMRLDDVSVELTNTQDQNGSRQRFTLRAYRRGERVAAVDAEHTDE